MEEIELRELRYFIAVAEELNFTRAAARLGMAQPPLSAAIGKLERKLGVTLLERTSRRVILTPARAVLLEQGRIAVEGVAAAVERARRQGTQARRLTVAVKPGGGTELLKKIMQRCARDPRLPEVHILFGHPGGPAAAVRGGAADIAILRTPFDQRGLDTELLLTEPRVAVLPTDHRLAGAPELRRADLAGEPMPRWAGQADPAATAYWAGADTPGPPRTQPGGRHPACRQAPRSTTSASYWTPLRSATPSLTCRSPSRTSSTPPTWPSCRSATSAPARSWRRGRTPAARAPWPASSARPPRWRPAMPSKQPLWPRSTTIGPNEWARAARNRSPVSWGQRDTETPVRLEARDAVHQARSFVRPAGERRRRAGHRPGSFSDAAAALDGAAAVMVTHEHPDHLDADAIRAALSSDPGITLWANQSVCAQFGDFGDQVHEVRHGDALEVAGYSVHVYGVDHALIHQDIPLVVNTGFLVEAELFHPGDSYTVPEDPVNTLLLPISAPWLKAGEMIDYFRAVGPPAATRSTTRSSTTTGLA